MISFKLNPRGLRSTKQLKNYYRLFTETLCGYVRHNSRDRKVDSIINDLDYEPIRLLDQNLINLEELGTPTA